MLKYDDIINDIRNNCSYTGKDIGIAVFDTGISPHEDLKERIYAFKNMVKGEECNKNVISDDIPFDDNGHGTHVAGIISGNGRMSDLRYRGIASGTKLVGVKVLNYKGIGKLQYICEGIDWVIENRQKYNIRVANFSVGGVAGSQDMETDVFVNAVRKLAKTGIIVVAAAGNNGPRSNTITVPGICREVITVGSSDDNIPIKTSNGKRYISDYSGRGGDSIILKPDITAPGSYITSCLNNRNGYAVKSGTSMASAVVSGAICLYLEKYKSATTENIRERLCATAYDGGRPREKQGCGILNIRRFLAI